MCAALAPQTRSEDEGSEKKQCAQAINEEDLGVVLRPAPWVVMRLDHRAVTWLLERHGSPSASDPPRAQR
jgi:hypothetical protein